VIRPRARIRTTRVSTTFARFARACAISAALAAAVYTVTFIVVIQRGLRWAQWTSSLALLAGALLIMPVFVGAWSALCDREREFALLGLLVGVASAFGTATHAIYDLANLAKNPGTAAASNLPSATDPRGFATFGLLALALLLFAWVAVRARLLTPAVGAVAAIAAASLIAVFLSRLLVLNPKSALIRPLGVLNGLVLNPFLMVQFARRVLVPARPEPVRAPGAHALA